MAVCAAYRIPHSQFLAWPEDDRDKALWWHAREAERCPHCGTRAAEWDPEQGGDRRAYVAEQVVCRGCQQLEARRAAAKTADAHGVQFVLTRHVPGPPAGEVTPDGREPSA